MKLNKLLLCSLFVLTGCNNNGIKTYKELPEVNNEQVKVDEPDDVKDIVGKNAYLSYQFNKANPIDEPLPAIKEDSYSEIATDTTKMDVKLESYNQTWATSLDDFAHYFGTYVINRRSYCVPLMDHNHEALKLYFKKMFCNAAYQIDNRETHIYSFKVNKLSLRTTSLKKLGQSNINSCYNEDFEKTYTEILQEKQSESTINNFLRKYGVGIFDTAVYASYDIEITSFRVHFANIGQFMSEFNETGVVPGASIDDHYRFTTFDTATNQYQEKLLSYEIIPFTESLVFPDIWYREDAYNYFVEVYNNFIANESERVLKGEHNVRLYDWENYVAFADRFLKQLESHHHHTQHTVVGDPMKVFQRACIVVKLSHVSVLDAGIVVLQGNGKIADIVRNGRSQPEHLRKVPGSGGEEINVSWTAVSGIVD